jgi:hypothetical protein
MIFVIAGLISTGITVLVLGLAIYIGMVWDDD